MANEFGFTVWEGASFVAAGPVVSQEGIDVGGTSQASTAVMHAGKGNAWRYVRVVCTEACWVTWGTTPVATADGDEGRLLPANVPEYFQIKADEKIAVINLAGA